MKVIIKRQKMKEKISNIFNIMCDIEYGFKDSMGKNIIDDPNVFDDNG